MDHHDIENFGLCLLVHILIPWGGLIRREKYQELLKSSYINLLGRSRRRELVKNIFNPDFMDLSILKYKISFQSATAQLYRLKIIDLSSQIYSYDEICQKEVSFLKRKLGLKKIYSTTTLIELLLHTYYIGTWNFAGGGVKKLRLLELNS